MAGFFVSIGKYIWGRHGFDWKSEVLAACEG